MWTKRKVRNRRTTRSRNVLDVKLRSSKVRAARARLAALTLGISFGAVFGIYLFWRGGEWALNRFVYQNPSFAIRKIVVQTDGVISPAQLRRWSGVKRGQNLLALDLANVKRYLELRPRIRSASVERILPSSLCIRVTERQPVARAEVPTLRRGGGIGMLVYQIDAAGYVMRPLDPRERAVPLSRAESRLPVISGLDFSELQPGRRIESESVHAALRFVTAFESSSLAGLVELRRVDVSAPQVLVATTEEGSKVTLSPEHFRRQLARWQEIHQVAQRMGRVIATLDLAVPNNIPARWMQAGPLQSAASSRIHARYLKRKNV